MYLARRHGWSSLNRHKNEHITLPLRVCPLSRNNVACTAEDEHVKLGGRRSALFRVESALGSSCSSCFRKCCPRVQSGVLALYCMC